jgi:hypothetical protein
MSKIISVYVFPTFGNFPNTINVGISTKNSNYLDARKVLVVMDITGSMGGFVNEKHKHTKYDVTIEMLTKLKEHGNYIDVLPFNIRPYELCDIENVPKPSDSTYFSPLVPEVERILKIVPDVYKGIILISDGLPSENYEKAYSAIQTLGNITRNHSINPVSLAVGCDADGSACALFSGKRGFECFIREESHIEEVVNDIHKGLHCSYEINSAGDFIPVENDGNFYFLSKEIKETSNNYTMEIIIKYINLIILQELSKRSPDYQNLRNFTKKITELCKDKSNAQMLYTYFDGIIGNIYQENVLSGMDRTSSAVTQRKQQFRSSSQQV